MIRLSGSEKSFMIFSAVLTELTTVTHRQTNGQTERQNYNNIRAWIQLRAKKTTL